MVSVYRALAALALLALLLPQTAAAQDMRELRRRAMAGTGSASHWEITAFNGIHLPKDLYQAGGAKLGMNDAYTFGGRLAYHPNLKLGVELSYARTHGALEVTSGATGFANPSPLGELVVQQADLGVVLSQESQASAKTVGFILLGAGGTRLGPEIEASSGSPTRTRLAWHAGIGTKLRVSDKLMLRLEGRYRSTNTDEKSEVIYQDANGNSYTFAPHWYRTAEVTAGLTFRLGG